MKTNPSPATKPVPFLPRAAISARVAVWSVLTGFAVTLPVLYLLLLLPLPTPSAEFQQVVAARKALVYLLPGTFFLKGVLIVPLIEEVFYRGILFTLLRRYVPMWLAVLVPTAIFALTHVGAGPANVGFALLVGLYFSWLVVRSGSLLANVLCHGAINLFVLFVMNPIWSVHHVDTPADFLGPLPLTMLAGSLALFIHGVRILRTEFTRRQTRGSSGLTPVSTNPVVA